MDSTAAIGERKRAPATFRPGGFSTTPDAPMGLRIGVISNPLSNGNRKGMQSVEKMLAGCGSPLHRRVVGPEEVKAAIGDFAARGINLVAVNGGDGTIHAVLTALFTAEWPDGKPFLALLRAGGASMIARDVGLPGSRLQGLSRLLDWAYAGRGAASLIKRPVLRLEWEKGGEPMYGMFFGACAIYDGIQFCHNRVYTKGLGGELAAGLTLLRFLLAAVKGDWRNVPRAPIRVGLEGAEMQEMDLRVLLVTTLGRLFLGIRPYWGTEGGPLHFTAVRSDAAHVLRATFSLIRGRRSRWGKPRHGYLSQDLREVRLCIQTGFTVDGQLYESDPRLGALCIRKGGDAEFLRL